MELLTFTLVSLILFLAKIAKEETNKFREASLKAITTDSIWRGDDYRKENSDWLEIASLGPLIARTICRMERGESISELFK